MKWVVQILVVGLTVLAWAAFMNEGRNIERLEQQLEQVWEEGDPDEEATAFEGKINDVKGARLMYGVLLTFLTAGAVGILFASYVLPFFAQRVTHAVFDSGEMVEDDPMRDARSLIAQGEYEAAIEALTKAAAADPMNRLPWVEVAKIQREQFEDSAAAIETLRGALEGQEWGLDDAAYFLFRIAELYDEDLGDRDTARQIMQQVIDDFPETRHSANAAQKVRGWESQGSDDALRAQEEAFLARQRAAEEQSDDADTPNS